MQTDPQQTITPPANTPQANTVEGMARNAWIMDLLLKQNSGTVVLP